MQAKFLHSKEIERLVESGGQDEPVLDFDQRMEWRKAVKWSIAISLM